MAFELLSSAFEPGNDIPPAHAAAHENLSPPLEWREVPSSTAEFALICEDPDAPNGTWIHWVLYRIPGAVRKLPQGLPAQEELRIPPGALQGRNSWDKVGYGGPMPPSGHGPHRYFFRMYALSEKLEIGPGADSQSLRRAMEGKVLAVAELMGRYETIERRKAG